MYHKFEIFYNYKTDFKMYANVIPDNFGFSSVRVCC